MYAEPVDLALPEAALGEGPLWDHRTGTLYWVDIEGGALHAYQPESGDVEQWRFEPAPAFVVLAPEGKLLLGCGRKLLLFNPVDGQTSLYLSLPAAQKNCRFNDARVDAHGRLWAGTMVEQGEQNEAALYCFEKQSFREIVPALRTSNGLCWSPDKRIFYHTDTNREGSAVLAYECDMRHGTVLAPRSFMQESKNGKHDGMTIDSHGTLYCAKWDGWAVECYSPKGKLTGKISLPAAQVTSCCFGGADLKTLYITTASKELAAAQKQEMPMAGRLFKARVPVAGLPEPEMVL